MRKHDIINFLIQKYRYQTYLEIGLDEGNYRNDEKIVCPVKISVDPAPGSRATCNMTSDDFFSRTRFSFDIVLIDGLHHADQVARDLDHSLARLNPGGTVVMHDCSPANEAMQRVPRTQREWTGDCWKAFVQARARPDLSMFVIDADYGVGIVRPGRQVPLSVPESELSYARLEANRREWLNLVSPEHALSSLL